MTQLYRSIWIGFDPREADAFAVCRDSIRQHLTQKLPISGLVLDDLRESGMYARPTQSRKGFDRPVLWDEISDAPMSTEFAISRFLIGHLAKTGYALFMDCDVLARANVARLFEICERDPDKAVWCVKHQHNPSPGLKMDGQPQTQYSRKNWSSVMVWRTEHPKNRALSLEMINTLPGRDLHRFSWLDDDDIGELDLEWNWLVGYSPPVMSPKLVHFTSGGPWLSGFEHVAFADEWRAARNRWAA